ncbi:MAG: NAD(P)-dependent oxidoreductase [Gaiellaceae bacterium]
MSTIAQEQPAGDVFAELRPPLSEQDAILEADRCLECGGPYAPAPCQVACPADVDVPGFIAAIAESDPATAASIIFAENLLGGTCSRVCPVEVLCQGACAITHEGRPPIAIPSLQRYATDHAHENGLPLRERAEPNGRKVAVIGAGPAGLVCAGELAARGYSVTVYDERAEVGGLVRYAIAPYRQQSDPLPAEARALGELGVEIRLGTPIDEPALRKLEQETEAIFLGIGMGEDQEVDLPGSELDGVWESLPFIERIKEGRPPKVGRRTIVIGGGNTAMDCAREALKLGSEEVTILYRRTEAEAPAFQHEIDEAREDGVQFRFLAAPVAFLGSWKLQAIRCRTMELGPPDDSGRRRPVPVEGADFELPVDTVVKALGQQPREQFLALIDMLELKWGQPVIDAETGQTTNPKYFAGGDAINGGATVVEAVKHAKAAARGIHAFLEGSR